MGYLGAIVAAVLLALLAERPAPAAGTIALEELLEHAGLYDQRIVTVRGEVIGEIMRRAAVTWTNVNDGTGDIGIWGPNELFSDISRGGCYANQGDIVEVTGVFRRSDLKQGGELDIEALQVRIMAPARKTDHPIEPARIRLAFGAALIAAMLAAIAAKAKRRSGEGQPQ